VRHTLYSKSSHKWQSILDCQNMIIKLPLRVISKKNSRRNFGRVSLPSKAYMNFQSLAGEYLIPLRQNYITKPFILHVFYHIKGNYHSDLDNAVTSVLDCLQHYQIISDDDLCIEIHARKENGSKDWLCEIELVEK